MECVICGKSLNKNHHRIHKISAKKYYDTYLKKNNEGKCSNCECETRYINFKKGYVKRCITCTNRYYAKLRKEKNDKIRKSKTLYKKCIICNNEFSTLDINRQNCYSYSCRICLPTEPKDRNDIKFYSKDKCPYCGHVFNKIWEIAWHITKHFKLSERKEILDFIIFEIWKIKWPKCKNLSCKNLAKRQTTFTFSNFCSNCLDRYSGGGFIYISKTNEEIQAIQKLAAIHSRETICKKMKDPIYQAKMKKIWRQTGEKNKINMIMFNKTEHGKLVRKETGKKLSKIMKEKIANGEFTPNITNSWTHWNAEIFINDIVYKFRSSWEACFFLSNYHLGLEYEVFRLPYIDKKNKERTFIGDFYDRKNSILYEIKPISSYLVQIEKINQAINYCINNNIRFIWINENNILNHIKKEKFDERNIIQYNMMLKGLNNAKNRN